MTTPGRPVLACAVCMGGQEHVAHTLARSISEEWNRAGMYVGCLCNQVRAGLGHKHWVYLYVCIEIGDESATASSSATAGRELLFPSLDSCKQGRMFSHALLGTVPQPLTSDDALMMTRNDGSETK